METTRGGIRAGSEFSSSVEFRKDQLHTRQTRAGFDVDGNTPPQVTDLNTSVSKNLDRDLCAVTRHGFINRVVDQFPQTMHQSARVGGPDIHPGALPNRLKTFEHGEVPGGIIRCCHSAFLPLLSPLSLLRTTAMSPSHRRSRAIRGRRNWESLAVVCRLGVME